MFEFEYTVTFQKAELHIQTQNDVFILKINKCFFLSVTLCSCVYKGLEQVKLKFSYTRVEEKLSSSLLLRVEEVHSPVKVCHGLLLLVTLCCCSVITRFCRQGSKTCDKYQHYLLAVPFISCLLQLLQRDLSANYR